MKTLPTLAIEWGVSLDALRATVRRSEQLKALGTKLGPTRAYNGTEAEQIRRAFAGRAKTSGKR